MTINDEQLAAEAQRRRVRDRDVVTFHHAGLACTMVFYPPLPHIKKNGHHCGYVDVPPGHPLWGVGDTDTRCYTLPCHGGITFAQPRPDGSWRLGFDCGHYDDGVMAGEVYRWTDETVRGEIESLAELLAGMGAAR